MHWEEALRQLREDERTRDIPIVVLSADARSEARTKLLSSGVQNFLTKPLSVRNFLETLDQLLA